MMKKRLKASKLISILQKKIAEYGDLDISINTQDGSSYFLYNRGCVKKIQWINKDGSINETLEIG